MEERISELEEKIELLEGICMGILDKIKDHEALQAQKECAIFDHIESVRKEIK
jgi:hypothetical protein